MAPRHLKDLENRLAQAHWHVVERFDGVDWREPAWWWVARRDRQDGFKLRFPPDPEKDAQTIADAYAAKTDIPGEPGLYFARGASWQKELDQFIAGLEAAFLPNSCEESEGL